MPRRGAIRARFVAPSFAAFPAFAADDRSIRAFATDQPGGGTDLIAWDLATGARARQPLPWAVGAGRPIAGSPDGTLLASADPAGRLALRDVATGAARGPFGSPALRTDWNVRPSFTPDGRALVLAGADGRVEAWDVATARLIRAIDLPFRGMRPLDLAVAPDGRVLAVSAVAPVPTGWSAWAWRQAGRINPAWGRPIRADLALVDLATGRQLARLRGGAGAAFGPDGRTVVTIGADGTLAVRDVPVVPSR